MKKWKLAEDNLYSEVWGYGDYTLKLHFSEEDGVYKEVCWMLLLNGDQVAYFRPYELKKLKAVLKKRKLPVKSKKELIEDIRNKKFSHYEHNADQIIRILASHYWAGTEFFENLPYVFANMSSNWGHSFKEDMSKFNKNAKAFYAWLVKKKGVDWTKVGKK